MNTLNLPIGLICRKFSIDGVPKEQLEQALARFSGGLTAGLIELDVAGKNQLQIFTDDPDLYEWLADEGTFCRALVGHLYGCAGNMLHGPGCECTLLAPSKRQPEAAGRAARA